MMSLETSSFEVTTAMAGALGAVQVAAHASVFSLTALAFMSVPVALSMASAIRWASCYCLGSHLHKF